MNNKKHSVDTHNSLLTKKEGGGHQYSRRQLLALSAASLFGACARGPVAQATEAASQAFSPMDKTGRKPNIIIYLADALRADALGVHNPKSPYTPFLDTFARESIVYDRCYSQSTWTKPSIASLYTGTPKGVHQTSLSDLKLGIQTLPETFTTLAEALGAAGYHTGLFLTNAQVSEKMGYRRGFEQYHYHLSQPALELGADALNWVDSLDDAPFFCFIHELDPHGPYTPTADTWKRLYDSDMEAAFESLPENDQALLRQFKYHYITEELGQPDLAPLTPRGRRYLRNLYLGEVNEVDGAFRVFCDELRKRGRLDDTFVIFTSDHGESLGEHDLFYHQNFMYWPEIHIPAIVRPPGGCDGITVNPAVGLYDLFPTLLEIGGAELPDYVDIAPLFYASGVLNSALDGQVLIEVAHQRPDPKDWITGIADRDVRVVWDPAHESFFAGPVFGSKAYTETEAMPPEWQERVPALQDRLEREMRRIAVARERFGPPPVLPFDEEWDTWFEEFHQDMQALGYL